MMIGLARNIYCEIQLARLRIKQWRIESGGMRWNDMPEVEGLKLTKAVRTGRCSGDMEVCKSIKNYSKNQHIVKKTMR